MSSVEKMPDGYEDSEFADLNNLPHLFQIAAHDSVVGVEALNDCVRDNALYREIDAIKKVETVKKCPDIEILAHIHVMMS